MSMTTRNPTMVAECGCPYDPDYDEDSLGWHPLENHIPDELAGLRLELKHTLERLNRIEQALRTRTDIYEKTAPDGHDLGTSS